MGSNNRRKNAAASFMSGFGKKVNANEEVKVEETVEEVVTETAEAIVEEVEIVVEKKEEPLVAEEKVEVKEALPEMIAEPVGEQKYEFTEANFPVAAVTVVKEAKKDAEKMVSYNFHIPYKVVKRLNRVIDEMKEYDVKMTKKDFILIAVEKAVAEYEKIYNVE